MSFDDEMGNPDPTEHMGTIRINVGDLEPTGRPSKAAFLNVIRSRADIGVHLFVEGPTVLGRNPNCTVPLHDFGVSWQHATITPHGENGYILQDLKSTNGTLVNGAPVASSHMLQDGEKIIIGETVIRFSLADKMDIDFHSEVATLVGKDPLTDLPSKRFFDERLEFAMQAASRGGQQLALLMMDMDGVREINNTHGHVFGAYVIGETGRLIGSVLGSKGRACRFGGDEFSAFMPAHDLESACAVAEQIRQAIETAKFEKDEIPLRPTISIGVAIFPAVGAETLEQFVSKADVALYRAKGQGKNCVAT